VEVQRNTSAAFFLAPLRAWELLIGTIVAEHYVPTIKGRIGRNAAALVGLVLILAPALRYTAATHFPGFAALWPCLGAALIIAAGENGQSIVGRVLGWGPFVFVGLISYSLYLWHWPIVVFQKTSFILVSAPSDSKTFKIACFIVSMVVATLSWALVETPFRKGRFRPQRRTLFAITGAAVVVLAIAGVLGVEARGYPARYPAEAIAIDKYNGFDPAAIYRENVCFITPRSHFSDFNKKLCLTDDPARKNYLLMGDSHGAMLYPGLHEVFPEINILQATTSSCRPFATHPPGTGPDCVNMWQFIYGDYLLHHPPDAVIIAGNWDEDEFDELGRNIETIKGLGLRVIVVGPMIEYDQPLPRLLTVALRDRDLRFVDRHRIKGDAEADRKLAALARSVWKVRYISVFEDLCAAQLEMVAKAQPETSGGCPVYAAPGVPLLFDTDHLTEEGSVLFAKAMRAGHQLD
jgi:hypothetical protein